MITLDHQSSSPLYRQICEQIRTRIFDGTLQPGTKIPTIRRLAADLKISKLTVFSAYQELQEAGLVECTVGYGTVVASKMPRTAGSEFLGTLTQAGPLNTYESVSHDIGVRSLASSVPDPSFFYADELLAECYALRRDSPWVFYYGPPAGAAELVNELADLARSRGIPARENEILTTNGSTHARSLILQNLTSPGDTVLYQDPGSLGTVEEFRACGLNAVPLRSDNGDIDLDDLDYLAGSMSPKIVSLAPTYGAATGMSMPLATCRDLLLLAEKHDFLILEQDMYARLSYDSPAPRPLAAMDTRGRVIYVDSLSYCLSPGLRTGFIRAVPAIRDKLVAASRLQSVSGIQFVQIGLARYLRAGRLASHLARVVPKYRARRDALLDALRFTMPTGVRYSATAGGFSSWVSLPPGGRYGTLYHAALEHGVAVSPGPLLTEREDADRFLRLSFGTQTPEAIRRAVEILARLVADRLAT